MSLFSELMAPTDAPATTPTPTPTQSMGKEDVIEFLGEEETPEVLDLPKDKRVPEEEEKEEEKEDKEDREDEDELKELEQELEGPTDDQLELVTPVRRREILKKYPNLFKDFPYLEKAYYREQQFTEVFPTIDDAKMASEKSQILDRFEADVLDGNTETILAAVKNDNPRGFNKIVDNYLITLSKVDEKAYHHVLGNVMKHTIVSMVQEGNRSNNDVLKSAAHILNQFIFGSSDFTPPTNLSNNSPDEDKQNNEIRRRQMEMNYQQLNSTVEDLNNRVNNTLRATIEANIDPRKSMSDYIRKNASKDAMDTLEDLISKDTRFKALCDKLWEKAIQENYSKSSVDRIKSAYLAKSKSLLPTVIKKARNEALRGSGKRVDKDDDDSTPTSSSEKRGPVSPGKPRSSSSGKISKPSEIPRGMRTLDFLNMD